MNSTDRPQLKLLNTRKRQALFIAGVAAILLAAMFAMYAILVTPARQPYRDALAQYQNVYNANIAVITAGAGVSASSATDEQFTAQTEQVNKALDALKAENEALGKVPVMATGESKRQYDAFTEKLNAYIEYNYDMVAAMQLVRPVMYACSQEMATVSETDSGVDTMQHCADDFADLENIPNEDYAELAATYQELYATFADNLAERAALKDPTGADKARYDELSDEQDDILGDMSDASSAFSKSLNQHKVEVDITEAAMTLDDYLSDASSIF